MNDQIKDEFFPEKEKNNEFGVEYYNNPEWSKSTLLPIGIFFFFLKKRYLSQVLLNTIFQFLPRNMSGIFYFHLSQFVRDLNQQFFCTLPLRWPYQMDFIFSIVAFCFGSSVFQRVGF